MSFFTLWLYLDTFGVPGTGFVQAVSYFHDVNADNFIMSQT